MICPKCNEQFDVYNAVLDRDSEEWMCPNCNVILNDSDAKEVYDEISKNDHQV